MYITCRTRFNYVLLHDCTRTVTILLLLLLYPEHGTRYIIGAVSRWLIQSVHTYRIYIYTHTNADRRRVCIYIIQLSR